MHGTKAIHAGSRFMIQNKRSAARTPPTRHLAVLLYIRPSRYQNMYREQMCNGTIMKVSPALLLSYGVRLERYKPQHLLAIRFESCTRERWRKVPPVMLFSNLTPPFSATALLCNSTIFLGFHADVITRSLCHGHTQATTNSTPFSNTASIQAAHCINTCTPTLSPRGSRFAAHTHSTPQRAPKCTRPSKTHAHPWAHR